MALALDPDDLWTVSLGSLEVHLHLISKSVQVAEVAMSAKQARDLAAQIQLACMGSEADT